jgi:DNA invertase Pin-like site-specific DNA recombinase
MKIGYARVSTKEQNETRQLDALFSAGVEMASIYIDKQSGKDFERKEYMAMMKSLRKGDTLIIKSIDRLGRNYEMIRKEYARIIDKGVEIVILDMPALNTDRLTDTGLTGKFVADIILTILGYVAEQERASILTRQKEGIFAAKKRGIKFGRPTKLNAKSVKVISCAKNGEITIDQACQLLNISRKSYYNYCNKLNNEQFLHCN